MKTGFSMKCELDFLLLKNTFSRSLNAFLASEFHIQSDSSVIKPITLEV